MRNTSQNARTQYKFTRRHEMFSNSWKYKTGAVFRLSGWERSRDENGNHSQLIRNVKKGRSDWKTYSVIGTPTHYIIIEDLATSCTRVLSLRVWCTYNRCCQTNNIALPYCRTRYNMYTDASSTRERGDNKTIEIKP